MDKNAHIRHYSQTKSRGRGYVGSREKQPVHAPGNDVGTGTGDASGEQYADAFTSDYGPVSAEEYEAVHGEAPVAIDEEAPGELPSEKKRADRKKTRSGKRRGTGLAYLCAGLLLLGIGIGFLMGRGASPRRMQSEAEETDEAMTCEVRYLLNGSELACERVLPGETLTGIGYPEQGGHAVIGWIDVNGNEVDPAGMIAYTDMSFTGISGWAMRHSGGYFPGESGAFLPEAPLTRLQAASLLYSLMRQPPEPTGTVSDLEPDCAGYEAVCSLVGEGLMDAPGGCFDPAGVLSADSFAALLSGFFRPSDVQNAVDAIRGTGGEAVTRAQAAVVLNRLLGVDDGEAQMLDVGSDYWAYGAIAAAQSDAALDEPLSPGFHNVDGWLYYIREDGSCLKNDYVNSLFFDGNGRYTSGSPELDTYVAAAIRGNTTEDMDQHEKLRAMYLYVRDGFTYYRRSAYPTGKTNFAVTDATTMYSTGMGNCYCYAAAFWAAARGLGYDAQAVSGTIGKEASPHGWVELMLDGERFVYDVEIEMAYLRDKQGKPDMFEMPFANARGSWMYIEYKDKNAVAPRDDIERFGNR